MQLLEMLQHLCCSYPAVAIVNTNMVANRGISSPLSTLLDNQSIRHHTFQQQLLEVRLKASKRGRMEWVELA